MSHPVDNQRATAHSWHTQDPKGEAYIAQLNRAGRVEVDRVVVADSEIQARGLGALEGSDTGIKIPRPTALVYAGSEPEERNLLALVGEVMTLQAKRNSDFWSDLWKMASLNMEKQVELAPLASAATSLQYEAQSKATSAQQAQSSANGSAYLMGAGGALVKNIYDEYKQESGTNPSPSDPAVEHENETERATQDEQARAQAALDPTQRTREEGLNEAADQSLQQGQPLGMRTGVYAKGKTEAFFKKFRSWLKSSITKVEQAAGFARLVVGMNDARGQNEQVTYKGLSDQAASTSRIIQAYAQGCGKGVGWMDDFKRGGGQNLSHAMNLLQQAANSLTHTLKAMFRE
jgi:hypothetical protein